MLFYLKTTLYNHTKYPSNFTTKTFDERNYLKDSSSIRIDLLFDVVIYFAHEV